MRSYNTSNVESTVPDCLETGGSNLSQPYGEDRNRHGHSTKVRVHVNACDARPLKINTHFLRFLIFEILPRDNDTDV